MLCGRSLLSATISGFRSGRWGARHGHALCRVTNMPQVWCEMNAPGGGVSTTGELILKENNNNKKNPTLCLGN